MSKVSMPILNSQILIEHAKLVALKKEVMKNKDPHSDTVIKGGLTLNTIAEKIAALLYQKKLTGKQIKENVEKCKTLTKDIRKELNARTLNIIPKIDKVINQTLEAVEKREKSKQKAVQSFNALEGRITQMRQASGETGAFALQQLQERLAKAKTTVTTPSQDVEEVEVGEDNPIIFEISDSVLDSALGNMGFLSERTASPLPTRNSSSSSSSSSSAFTLKSSSSSSSSSDTTFKLKSSSSKSSSSSFSDDELESDEEYAKKLLAESGSPFGKLNFDDSADTILETQLCNIQDAVMVTDRLALTKTFMKLQSMQGRVLVGIGQKDLDIAIGDLVFFRLDRIIANESPDRYKPKIDLFGASAFGFLNGCTSTPLERGRAVLRARVDVLLHELINEYEKEYMDNHSDLIAKVSRVCIDMRRVYPADLISDFAKISKWNHPQLDNDEDSDAIIAARVQHLQETRETIAKAWH